MKARKRYSPEVRERAVRMVFEHSGDHNSQWETISSIASKIGCTAETLRKWVRRAERDQGLRPGLTSEERSRMKELMRLVLHKATLGPDCLKLGLYGRPPEVGQLHGGEARFQTLDWLPGQDLNLQPSG